MIVAKKHGDLRLRSHKAEELWLRGTKYSLLCSWGVGEGSSETEEAPNLFLLKIFRQLQLLILLSKDE